MERPKDPLPPLLLVTGIGVGAVALPRVGLSPRLRAAGVHEFPCAALTARRIVVEGRLAGSLELAATARRWQHHVFLPLVTNDYATPWWPRWIGE